MPRFLVLSAAMGGGHLQISRELARRLRGRGHTAAVVDMLELMPGPTGDWLRELYPFLVNRTPGLYQRIYNTFFLAEQRAGERAGLPVRLALPALRHFAAGFSPDLAVSTYPLCSLALGELRSRGALDCPAVTVVTTFAVNNLWLHPGVDQELCISRDAADDAARRTGREAGVCGPVVRPGFGDSRADGTAFRSSLGVSSRARVALLSTGSMGLAGDVVTAAREIAQHEAWIPVVLCGRQGSLRAELEEIPGVKPVEWVEDMPAAMAAADVLVDNNCGMAAKEALAAGLPVVTFRPIPGHGLDDAGALARLGLTEIVSRAPDLVPAIERVTDEDLRRERLVRGHGLFVADAAELLEEALPDHRPAQEHDRISAGRTT
ncbi:MAG TPA: glycosyltransferase [Marmoricola sp.]|nr:glycosyltransferase [Marmoricola sp.]